MSWSQTSRILLVWPKKGQVLTQRIDIVMVKRHASRLGAQLALVTHDTEVRFIANQEGIPVFKDLRQAQNTHWRINRIKRNTSPPEGIRPSIDTRRKLMQFKSQDWLQHPATRILLFGISVSALFMLGIFILPGATIFLTPMTDIQSMDLRITADPSLEDINLSNGSLPTYIQEVIVEGRKNAATTGSMMIPDKAAKGMLQFTNISVRDITIPIGTVVTTLGIDPVRFVTLSSNDVVIKPGTSDDINVRSIAPGKSGNLPPNTLVAIEGNLGSDLTVTNPNATYGGTDASASTPTNQDFRLLDEQLIKDLEQIALKNMNKLIPSDDSLITPTLKITEILDETATPAIGEPGSQLSISMRLRFESMVVSSEKLNNLITPILDANIPHGYTPIDNSIILKQLTNPILGTEGNAYWTINAQRDIRADIVSNQIVNQISGKSTPQAIDQLNDSLPLANEARIILAPKWWPRLPFLPLRIQIVQVDT